jgi:hypothetical protein
VGLREPAIGLIGPVVGLIRPFVGLIGPVVGLIGPFAGLIGPVVGLIRLFVGLARPVTPAGEVEAAALEGEIAGGVWGLFEGEVYRGFEGGLGMVVGERGVLVVDLSALSISICGESGRETGCTFSVPILILI